MIDLEELERLKKLVEEKKQKERVDAKNNIITFQPRTLTDNQEDDLIPPPEPTKPMFYGLVGKMAAIAAEKTEVNPVAAATAFLSFLGANVGRDTFLNIANTCHHPRLFTLHIGRSGRGRKGDSQQPLRDRSRVVPRSDSACVFTKR